MRSLEAYEEALGMLSTFRGETRRSDERFAGIDEVSEEAVTAVIERMCTAQSARLRTGPRRGRKAK